MSSPSDPRPTGLAGLLNSIHLAILLVCALVGWGLFSLYEIRKESWPDVEMPLGLVKIIYPGAPPDLVEAEVTNIVETHLKGLPDLTSLKSSSIQNSALILAEFDLDADIQESLDALRDRVAEAEVDLPDDVASVSVQQIGTSNQPIYAFSLSGEFPPEVLRRFAIELRDRLEGIEGVSEVRINGMRDEQLQVLVQQQPLEEIGGTLSDVVGAIQKSQTTTPVGRLQSEERNFSLDIDRVGLDVDKLNQLMVRAAATGDNVPLSSVATLKRALSEPTEHTRLIRHTEEGVLAGDAISFEILRQPGADVPKVVRRVRTELDAAKKELPPSLSLTVTADTGQEIIDGLAMLFSNGAQAVLLVFIILFLVLGVRESIIAGLSIPLTFLAVFGVLYLIDESVNNLSLMALVIALGLLVDDFILIMEGMHEELEHGQRPLQAAVNTLRNFAVPSLSGSLTTLAAFFPIAMLGGTEGKFIQVIPLTICISLISSYLVSITIDTSFGAAVLKHTRPNFLTARVNQLFDSAVAYYEERIFPRTLLTRAQRRMVLGVTTLTFGISLVAATQLQSILYPATDESQLGASLSLPPGTTLAQTEALMADVEALLAGDPDIQHFTLVAGAKSGLAMSGPESYLEPFQGEQLLGVTMQLVDQSEREAPSYDLAETYRDKLVALGSADVEMHQIRMGGGSGAPVEIEIVARSAERAEAIADDVRAIAEEVEGLIGLKDTRKPHQGAFRFELSEDALSFHNLDRGSVLQFLFYAISGTTADTVYENGDEVAIEVGYDWRDDGTWNSPERIEDVLSLKVPGFFGTTVPLAGITDVELKSAPIGINHTNRRYVVTVSADAVGSPVEAADTIEARLKESGVVLQTGEAINFLGDKASSAETNQELGQAFLLALALIFSILVAQFRSFTQPFIILITMPLAMTGVFLGFLVTGIPLSFPAMIGMVALVGIVVNDSIVLIDAINRGRWEDGLEPIAAVLQGCVSRMRPIMVTTVTTIIGLIPLALTDPVWEGLCMAIIFGISLATILTMVVIPAIYLTLARAGDAARTPNAQPRGA
ncbi:MAG: efflux RND transporter permease subunit [Myxococcota bacterium]